MKPFLSVIIPAHDGSKRLPLALVDIDKKLSEADYSYEILVVDDDSEDKISDMVARFGRIVKNLKLVDIGGYHGRGWASEKGDVCGAGQLSALCRC